MLQDVLYDKDRKVRVYLDGTPVVNSSLQSQYSKYLNFKNRFSVTSNNDKYDIDFKYSDQVLTKLGNVQVGTQPRYLNFNSSDFTDVEDVPNNNYNIGLKIPSIPRIDGTAIATTPRFTNFKNDFTGVETSGTNSYDITLRYPYKVKVLENGVALNTTPRTLNFSTGIDATEDVAGDRITVTSNTSQNPRISNKYVGLFPGTTSSLNSNPFRSGSGLFNSWTAYNRMDPKVDTTHGAYLDWVTGGSSGNFCAYQSDDSVAAAFSRKLNPFIEMKIRIPDLSSNRCYFGFTDTLPLPTNAFNFLNGKIGFGLRFDTGQDNNWAIMYNDGASTNPTPIDSGVSVDANTVYTFQIFADEAGGRFGVTISTGVQSSTAQIIGTPTYRTTSIPLTNDPLSFGAIYTTQTGSARHMHMFYTYGESQML